MSDKGRENQACLGQAIAQFRAFVAAPRWTYAKTMPRWPHEYVMRRADNAAGFDEAARLIYSHGFPMRLRTKSKDYLDVDGWCYWAMGDSGGSDDIINRTRPKTRAAFHAMVNGERHTARGVDWVGLERRGLGGGSKSSANRTEDSEHVQSVAVIQPLVLGSSSYLQSCGTGAADSILIIIRV